MIIWDYNPIALSLGPLQVRWYGIIYAAGFLLGYLVLRMAAKRKLIKNFTPQLAEDYILLLMMGIVIFARLIEVLVYNPIYYLHNLLEIPAVWHGGLSFHGGLLGAVIVSWYFCKKKDINFYTLADLLVLPMVLALILGRVANFINGELYGKPTDVSWCVVFPGVDGCRHPSQIYEALYGYAIFFILLVFKETKKLADGVLFWSFVLLYGVFRFFTNFYREPDYGVQILGLGTGQWLCVIMVIVALLWFAAMRKTGHPLVQKA